MEPTNSVDVAIGWGLIAAMALAAFYGIPALVGILVRTIRASLEQQRLERERRQEDLDELARQELLAIVAKEQRD